MLITALIEVPHDLTKVKGEKMSLGDCFLEEGW